MSHLKTTLALLIIAEGQQRKLPLDPDDNPFETDVHVVIERLLHDWSDERKADLYALLVEKLRPDMWVSATIEEVGKCLDNNARRFPHG